MASLVKTDKIAATTGGAQEFTLPTADGTANQVLKTNASGVLSFADGYANNYSTGTWTPVFAGSGTAGSFTYTAQIGHYTKIGNVVVAQFRVAISAISVAAAGYLYILGFPFAAYVYHGLVVSAI